MYHIISTNVHIFLKSFFDRIIKVYYLMILDPPVVHVKIFVAGVCMIARQRVQFEGHRETGCGFEKLRQLDYVGDGAFCIPKGTDPGPWRVASASVWTFWTFWTFWTMEGWERESETFWGISSIDTYQRWTCRDGVLHRWWPPWRIASTSRPRRRCISTWAVPLRDLQGLERQRVPRCAFQWGLEVFAESNLFTLRKFYISMNEQLPFWMGKWTINGHFSIAMFNKNRGYS